MKKAVAGFAFVFAACGGFKDDNKDGIADGVRDPNSVSQVAPSTPVGTVTGTLVNSHIEPLEGAVVTINIGGRVDPGNQPYRATTDAEGKFAFKGLPAGSNLSVSMTKMGYGTIRTQTTIPAAAGNFPINDGNADIGTFALLELNSTFKVRVVTASGRPAKGARAYLEAFPLGSQVTFTGTYGTSTGLNVVDATADDMGVLSFAEVQNPADMARLSASYVVAIAGYDEDGDGVVDYAGGRYSYPGYGIYTDPSVRVIALTDAHTSAGVQVIATNVDSMIHGGSAPGLNFVRPNDDLFFTFNQNLMESSILVSLTDESGVTPVMFTRELRQGNVVVVKHPAMGWENGKEYNISVRANSKDNGYVFTGAGYFFGAEPANPKPFAVATVQFRKLAAGMFLSTGDRVIATFNQPIARRSAASPYVELYFDLDLDGDNMRNSVGERGGTASGFELLPNEPIAESKAEFVSQASGYTTRHEFIYGGPALTVVSPTVFINFAKLMNADNGYQTIWGVSVSADETTQLGMAQ